MANHWWCHHLSPLIIWHKYILDTSQPPEHYGQRICMPSHLAVWGRWLAGADCTINRCSHYSPLLFFERVLIVNPKVTVVFDPRDPRLELYHNFQQPRLKYFVDLRLNGVKIYVIRTVQYSTHRRVNVLLPNLICHRMKFRIISRSL